MSQIFPAIAEQFVSWQMSRNRMLRLAQISDSNVNSEFDESLISVHPPRSAPLRFKQTQATPTLCPLPGLAPLLSSAFFIHASSNVASSLVNFHLSGWLVGRLFVLNVITTITDFRRILPIAGRRGRGCLRC